MAVRRPGTEQDAHDVPVVAASSAVDIGRTAQTTVDQGMSVAAVSPVLNRTPRCPVVRTLRDYPPDQDLRPIPPTSSAADDEVRRLVVRRPPTGGESAMVARQPTRIRA